MCVFVNAVATENLHNVELPVGQERTLWEICLAVAKRFDCPLAEQEVTILASPGPTTYQMARLLPSTAEGIRVPPAASVLLRINPIEPVVQQKPSSYLGESGQITWQPTLSQKRGNIIDLGVRKPVRVKTRPVTIPPSATMLQSGRITLQALSQATGYSKAALSMWRRGVYPGDGHKVARAVEQVCEAHGIDINVFRVTAPEASSTSPSVPARPAQQ